MLSIGYTYTSFDRDESIYHLRGGAAEWRIESLYTNYLLFVPIIIDFMPAKKM